MHVLQLLLRWNRAYRLLHQSWKPDQREYANFFSYLTPADPSVPSCFFPLEQRGRPDVWMPPKLKESIWLFEFSMQLCASVRVDFLWVYLWLDKANAWQSRGARSQMCQVLCIWLTAAQQLTSMINFLNWSPLCAGRSQALGGRDERLMKRQTLVVGVFIQRVMWCSVETEMMKRYQTNSGILKPCL